MQFEKMTVELQIAELGGFEKRELMLLLILTLIQFAKESVRNRLGDSTVRLVRSGYYP